MTIVQTGQSLDEVALTDASHFKISYKDYEILVSISTCIPSKNNIKIYKKGAISGNTVDVTRFLFPSNSKIIEPTGENLKEVFKRIDNHDSNRNGRIFKRKQNV